MGHLKKRERESYEKLSEDEYTMLLDENGVKVKEHTEYEDEKAIKEKENILKQIEESGQPVDPMTLEQINNTPIPMLHDVVIERRRFW